MKKITYFVNMVSQEENQTKNIHVSSEELC